MSEETEQQAAQSAGENEGLAIAPGEERDVTNQMTETDEARDHRARVSGLQKCFEEADRAVREDPECAREFEREQAVITGTLREVLELPKLEARVAFLEEFLSKTHGHDITKN